MAKTTNKPGRTPGSAKARGKGTPAGREIRAAMADFGDPSELARAVATGASRRQGRNTGSSVRSSGPPRSPCPR